MVRELVRIAAVAELERLREDNGYDMYLYRIAERRAWRVYHRVLEVAQRIKDVTQVSFKVNVWEGETFSYIITTKHGAVISGGAL